MTSPPSACHSHEITAIADHNDLKFLLAKIKFIDLLIYFTQIYNSEDTIATSCQHLRCTCCAPGFSILFPFRPLRICG